MTNAAPAQASLLVTGQTRHIAPTRLVDIAFGAEPTADDLASMVATVRAYWSLTHNLAELSERGAVVVLSSGDEVELSPEAIDAHMSDEGERAEMAANEAYCGGDAPGSYGPSDPRGVA